jgi:hypothetical protein
MNRKHIAACASSLILLAGIGSTMAQTGGTCLVLPTPTCNLASDDSSSQLQIGGSGSKSNWNNTPAACDNGVQVQARFQFAFQRSLQRLTLRITSQMVSPNTAKITGFAFNTAPEVSGVSLVAVDGNPETWTVAYDQDRLDGLVNSPPLSGQTFIRADGFGRVSVFGGNNGFASRYFEGNSSGGIGPGESALFTFHVTGDLPNISACSFTSIGTIIPPGDKTTTAVARFQACGAPPTKPAVSHAWAGPCFPIDLLVDLLAFEVESDDSRAILTWETASEPDNAGFAILRENVHTGEFERISGDLIAPRGTATSGASYSFEDDTAVNGVRARYRLETWDLDGFNKIYDPVDSIANPRRPPIQLVGPTYDGTLRRGVPMRVNWEPLGGVGGKVLVEFSADPEFPKNAVVSVTANSSRRRATLSSDQARRVGEMAAVGTGGVYWRVIGTGRQGKQIRSQTFYVNVTD